MARTNRGSLASFFLRLGRQVWVRAALFTVIGIAIALIAGFVGPLLPFSVTIDLGQNAVGSLLQIIATAMLTALSLPALAQTAAPTTRPAPTSSATTTVQRTSRYPG